MDSLACAVVDEGRRGREFEAVLVKPWCKSDLGASQTLVQGFVGVAKVWPRNEGGRSFLRSKMKQLQGEISVSNRYSKRT